MHRHPRFLAFLFITLTGPAFADSVGKTPVWNEDGTRSTANMRPQGKPLTDLTAGSELAPAGPGSLATPSPFLSLENAVAFIQQQRGLHGQGLPALFWAPPTLILADPLENLLVHEGVGLYDTSLAILVLIDAGKLEDAKQLLDFYVDGHYGQDTSSPMDLRAAPSVYNNNAFEPFDADAFYYFDFTNVYGEWLRWGERWKFWTVHTGPNAWLANAALHYVLALRRRGASAQAMDPYLALAERIALAMQRLQDKNAGGGIRYAPRNVWHAEDVSDPYLELNTENNVSAYAVFRLLATLTGKPTYKKSADHILQWFQSLMDPLSGTLAMGMVFKDGHWQLQPEHPTDGGGTWTLSSLGAAQMDALWGKGAAYRMWRSLRARAGRSASFTAVGSSEPLGGLDFIDEFPIAEALISPEWSGGGLFALRELLTYYGGGAGQGQLSPAELQGLQADWISMKTFIQKNPNPYAIGPGHGGKRQGATGFHWSSPPPEVHALASLYFVLAATGQADPLADWRLLPTASTK